MSTQPSTTAAIEHLVMAERILTELPLVNGPSGTATPDRAGASRSLRDVLVS
jgi:hypothetical protein